MLDDIADPPALVVPDLLGASLIGRSANERL
jgi:hypothetical protein